LRPRGDSGCFATFCLLDSWTDISAGFSPLRTRAAVVPTTRYASQLLIEDAHPRHVPAGAGKAADKPHGDRASAAREYNRNGQGCAFRGKSRGIPECRNERDVIAYQIAGELGQAIEFTIGITKLQDDVASLDVVGAGQPAAKCRQSMGAIAVQDGSPVLASKSAQAQSGPIARPYHPRASRRGTLQPRAPPVEAPPVEVPAPPVGFKVEPARPLGLLIPSARRGGRLVRVTSRAGLRRWRCEPPQKA
jgi:hypothetical protein